MKQHQKPCTRMKAMINIGKASKTSNEVKPVDNINKNPLKISSDKSRVNESPSSTKTARRCI